MKSLRRLENWIEHLVEQPFVRLFAGRLSPQDVAQHLARALEDGERVGADGTPEVPGRYRVALNPDDLAALQRHHPNLDAQLASALETLAESMKVRLMEAPAFLLEPRADLPLHTVKITPADRPQRPDESTRDLDLERMRQRLAREVDHRLKAYLIVQGRRTYDLQQPTTRLGRAFDNDLILEDPRISRHHAQLHYRYGRYVLQDLGSSSGTLVNGFHIQEIVLRPGDVISLAGIDLIYAEDQTAGAANSGSTQALSPAEDDHA